MSRTNRPTEHVERPALTLAIATQPDRLAEIGRPEARGRGFCARMLYAVPPSTVGTRDVAPAPVDAAVSAWWTGVVSTLAERCGWHGETLSCVLDADADALLREFERDLEPRLEPGRGDLADLVDWASKLAGNVARVAAILHLASDPTGTLEVPVEVMHAAIRFGSWAIGHARRAYVLMGAGARMSDAQALAHWLATTTPTTFTVRDVQRQVPGFRHRRAADIRGALDELSTVGWVTRTARPYTGVGRPASDTYAVSPWLSARIFSPEATASRSAPAWPSWASPDAGSAAGGEDGVDLHAQDAATREPPVAASDTSVTSVTGLPLAVSNEHEPGTTAA